MAYEYTTRDGKRVEVEVAEAFDKLAAAFSRQFGLTLHVRSGTRTTAEQQRLYDLYKSGRGSLAAVPGTSNHEEGGPTGPRALDVYDSGKDWGVTRAGSVRANWLRRNALAIANFDPAGYRFSQVEPWHIEYRGQLSGQVAQPSNPFGIADVRGLQKLAIRNGGKTAIDNKWGPESAKGFANFLRTVHGYEGNDTLGPNMWAAIARWLRARWGYSGNDTPGPVMRSALSRANQGNFDGLNDDGSDKVAAPPPAPPVVVAPAPAPAPSNPFGIADVRGLQKIARQNGGATAIDNKWGPESAKGFSNFLERKYGYQGNDTLGPVMWAAIARWLRARWGYVGDDVPGPKMRAALTKANAENFEHLK